MGPIGMQEMIAIAILALLLFGPKKLPELARMLGKGLSEFRRAKNELQSTFETHMRELERETRAEDLKKSGAYTVPAPDYSSPRYPYAADEYGQDSSSYDHSYHAEPAAIAAPSDAITPAAVAPNGTIARSNGIHPSEPAMVPPKEEHPG